MKLIVIHLFLLSAVLGYTFPDYSSPEEAEIRLFLSGVGPQWRDVAQRLAEDVEGLVPHWTQADKHRLSRSLDLGQQDEDNSTCTDCRVSTITHLHESILE